MRLLQALYRHINEKPDHEILTVNERTYSYIDIKKNIDRWKLVLQCCGISPRYKIIVCLKKTIDFVGLYFALCELDCIMIPMDVSTNQDIIPKVIHSSKAHAVISSQALYSDEFQKTIPLSLRYTFYRTTYEEEYIQDSIMQMLYTSGTTGLPKCVMFSKENMANNIIVLADTLKLSENDVIYTPISLMLPAALNTVLLPALLTGTRIVVSDSTVPSSVLRHIIEQGVTVFFAVPFYYKLITASGLCTEDTWKNVRLCLTSSAYLSEENFLNFYKKSKKGLHSIYCSSEAGTIAYNDSNDIASLRKFVGKPLNGCEVSLIDINEEGLGEIIVKGDMVSSRYYLNEALNNEVFCNEWIKTGDIGLIHENGYLEIKGRISETINIAGHLVNPLEIEQVIMRHEAVKDVVAYKYRNRADNDMLGVKVLTKERGSLSERDIISCCQVALPSYKVPKKVLFVDNIDVGRYGKKRRRI
ncbi:long-chain fatty acid--CoA ligase [Vallitalea sediminicola]